MKTRTSISHNTFAFAFVLLVAIIFCGCNYIVVVVDIDEMKTAFEQAYFEGQKDALEGDVRIRKNNDSCWIWTKSCWDSGEQPTFNPSIVCGERSKK